MSRPQVVSRGAWLAARKELLTREQEVARSLAELSAQRRALPAVEVDQEYVFEGPDGKASLLDLFQQRSQLIVQHFMFDPSWDEGCRYCSYQSDSIGHLAHLHARDTSLVVVSRAPLTKIEPFKARMGWTFPWYSSLGSSFNYDFHVTLDEAVAPVEYKYKDQATLLADGEEHCTSGEQGGVSVFRRDGDTVFHTYSAYEAGTELLHGTDLYLDLTPLGRPDIEPQHHDRYADLPS